MISEHNLASLIGADVVDPDGHKIGTIGKIYVDPATGRPKWASVLAGFFGASHSFVPLDQANAVGGELRVPYAKDVVKDSPRITDDAGLSDDDEEQLNSYYEGPGSMGSDPTLTDTGMARNPGETDSRADTTKE